MTSPVLRAAWVLLVFLGFLGWCARAVAGNARPQIVVVAAAEHGPAVTQLFQAVVHARLPEVLVRYVPEDAWQPAGSGAADLVLRLDTARDSEWLLRLEYRGRTWTRTIEGGLSQDAAAVEAAALMAAHTSVALLTEAATTSATPEALKTWVPEPPPPPAPVARQPPEPEVRRGEPSPPRHDDFWWLELMAGYRGQIYSADHPWLHAGKLSLLGQLPQGPCATLGAALVQPTGVDSEFGSFTLRRQEAELLAGWCFRWGRWGVSPRAGVLADITERAEATPAPGVGASPDQRQIGWAGVTALEGRWSVLQRLQLFFALSAAYFLTDREFVASGVSEPVLAPYRVRFSLDLGLSLGLF